MGRQTLGVPRSKDEEGDTSPAFCSFLTCPTVNGWQQPAHHHLCRRGLRAGLRIRLVSMCVYVGGRGRPGEIGEACSGAGAGVLRYRETHQQLSGGGGLLRPSTFSRGHFCPSCHFMIKSNTYFHESDAHPSKHYLDTHPYVVSCPAPSCAWAGEPLLPLGPWSAVTGGQGLEGRQV